MKIVEEIFLQLLSQKLWILSPITLLKDNSQQTQSFITILERNTVVAA